MAAVLEEWLHNLIDDCIASFAWSCFRRRGAKCLGLTQQCDLHHEHERSHPKDKRSHLPRQHSHPNTSPPFSQPHGLVTRNRLGSSDLPQPELLTVANRPSHSFMGCKHMSAGPVRTPS